MKFFDGRLGQPSRVELTRTAVKVSEDVVKMQTVISQTEELEVIKNCLIYARVSTDRQVREGHSLEDQVNRLFKYARDKGWRVLEVFKDGGKSGGSTTGRPEFTRMLERCGHDENVHAIILEETDRFARDAQDHLAVKSFLKKHQVRLITTEQPNFGDDPTGKFIDLVMAGANQLQREITGEKTRRTMIALAEKGFQPGVAVIGYHNSFKKNEPWRIDKERTYFIREAFKRYHTGNYSIYRLEEELYTAGFRNKRGGKVKANVIHKILTDVRYAGKVLYMNKIYNGQHQAIVSMEDVKKSEVIMANHNKGADRSRKHNWFLAGLVHCKACGSLMTGEKHVKKNGLKFWYYRCLGPKTRGQTCDEPYAPMKRIHEQLEEHLTGMKFDPRFFLALRCELEGVMRSQGKDIPGKIKGLEDRKRTVEKKMDKLEDEMIAEIIPRERIDQKYIPLRDELQTIEGEISKLQRPSANLDEKKIDTILGFMGRLPELWRSFNKQEKKQFLKWFVEKVWIKKKKVVDITYTEAFQAFVDMDLVRIRTLWLPSPRISITVDFANILAAFQNLSYIGELRQRWEEIKRLLKGGLQDDIPAAMLAK